ncbi:MAG: sugar phosphate isomerase/epimerase [Pirellulaceae bacterium]|nr:sugar phosphate isomerase/epimerase [Pirellulaceae bacterium]
MILGYNTNGFANHDALSAIKLLAGIGYQSVAITVDHHCLNPFSDSVSRQIKSVKNLLQEYGLSSVIETGARFLLDPAEKHEPTLMSANPKKRIDFYKYCVDVAAELGSNCVSIWSGILREDVSDEVALDRLARGLESVVQYADGAGVIIGFEPEPGMFIDSTSGFTRLKQWVNSPCLKMTMDVGHLYCMHEMPIADYLHRFADDIINVHIEDMRAGIHEHLMFGEGEMSFPPIIEALGSIEFEGGLHVELSRHSHDAPRAARKAYEFLQPLLVH